MSSKIIKNMFSVENNYKNGKKYKVMTFLGVKFNFSLKNNQKKNKDILDCERDIVNLKKEIARLKGKVQNLENIISAVGDARNCKPATGNFRLLQLVRAKALKLIVMIFEKYNIEYWMDFGTCLGALRHKGFIPWDDDIDIATTRESYEKIEAILEKELEGTCLRVDMGGYGRTFLIRVLDRNSKFHYVDIFPYDRIGDGKTSETELKQKWKEIRTQYQIEFPTAKLRTGEINRRDTIPRMFELYKEYGLISDNTNTDGEYIVRGIDSATTVKIPSMHSLSYLYPLRKTTWEGFDVNVPNDMETYCKNVDDGAYGDIWALPDLSVFGMHGMAKNLKDKDFIAELNKKNKDMDLLLEKYQKEA
jgi:lipopolysaccharide cholinephosphotransferase